MDKQAVRKCKDEIEKLEKYKDACYQGGFVDRVGYVTIALNLIGLIGGMGSVVSILQHGINWVSAGLLALGAYVFFRERSRERSIEFCRDEYRKAAAQLEDLEREYKNLTYDPLQFERDMQELLRKR